jgi:hypothetical protein
VGLVLNIRTAARFRFRAEDVGVAGLVELVGVFVVGVTVAADIADDVRGVVGVDDVDGLICRLVGVLEVEGDKVEEGRVRRERAVDESSTLNKASKHSRHSQSPDTGWRLAASLGYFTPRSAGVLDTTTVRRHVEMLQRGGVDFEGGFTDWNATIDFEERDFRCDMVFFFPSSKKTFEPELLKKNAEPSRCGQQNWG